MKFELTEDHIKLLRNAYVSWGYSETGAPAIDSKRPYGNSRVPADIHEILTCKRDYYDLSESDREQLEATYLDLHRETEVALQIILFTGKFEPGTYENPRYTNEWRKV